MPDISKIHIENATYEIKDSELRDMIDILLGRKQSLIEEETSDK